MADIIWDVGQNMNNTVNDIQDFLYVEGKPTLKGGKPATYKNHTVDEYRKMLESIMENSRTTYTELAKDHGWI